MILAAREGVFYVKKGQNLINECLQASGVASDVGDAKWFIDAFVTRLAVCVEACE